jgi:hypothetical protein
MKEAMVYSIITTSHGEDHASHGRVERPGNCSGRAAGHQGAQRVVRQLRHLPHQAGAGSAEMNRRTFAATGNPSAERDDATAELRCGIASRQVALMAGQPLQHVRDAEAQTLPRQPSQQRRQQRAAEQRPQKPLGEGQRLESLRISVRQRSGEDQVDGATEGQYDQPGQRAGQQRQRCQLRQRVGTRQTLTKAVQCESE